VRCWRARRRQLAPGALDAVASDLLEHPVEPARDPVDAVAAALPSGGWVHGHTLRLFSSNSQDFARRLALIEAAQTSIACTFWCIAGDATGRRFLEALAARARAGVRITVVLDANIAARLAWIDPTYRDFLADLAATGIELHLLRPPSPWLNTHRKLFVVDRCHAIVGGRNIGDHYAVDDDEGFLDTDVELRGPLAEVVHAEVMALVGEPCLAAVGTPEAAEGAVALVDQPARLHPVDDTLVRCLVQAVRHARRSVDLAFAYLIVPRALERALLEAHERGVSVRLVTNSAASVDYPYWAGAAYGSLDPLVRAGVPLWLQRGRCMHSKCAVVDAALCTVGSHNLWSWSTLHDAESNLWAVDSALAASLTARIEDHIAGADRVDPALWQVPGGVATRLANAVIWGWRRP